jgi:hypothetical protein
MNYHPLYCKWRHVIKVNTISSFEQNTEELLYNHSWYIWSSHPLDNIEDHKVKVNGSHPLDISWRLTSSMPTHLFYGKKELKRTKTFNDQMNDYTIENFFSNARTTQIMDSTKSVIRCQWHMHQLHHITEYSTRYSTSTSTNRTINSNKYNNNSFFICL